jgi:Fe-S-cluster containining protein
LFKGYCIFLILVSFRVPSHTWSRFSINPVPADPEHPPEYLTAAIQLSIAGRDVRLEAPIPTAPARPIQLLPLFHSLSDTVVDLTVKSVEEEGAKISCKKGCGACCRQLVPISATEARRIRDLVNEMPEPRRSEILARFEAARGRLDEAGLLAKLVEPDKITEDETVQIGLDYFSKSIPCPFLEDESCSIHADRPAACREYLVTSPAGNCAHPTPETVSCVPMKIKVSTALRCMTMRRPHDDTWVSLILAPSWAETHPDDSPPRPGTELVSEFFSFLRLKEVPRTGGGTP